MFCFVFLFFFMFFYSDSGKNKEQKEKKALYYDPDCTRFNFCLGSVKSWCFYLNVFTTLKQAKFTITGALCTQWAILMLWYFPLLWCFWKPEVEPWSSLEPDFKSHWPGSYPLNVEGRPHLRAGLNTPPVFSSRSCCVGTLQKMSTRNGIAVAQQTTH